ncbi:hypothetical protein K443DRAFT_685668 [Laccaria amethystina LaAM-08-1]|uniref:Uncharacterized protein n=1 Tax=Laccaria amethystina LaAM-08-1 TaxID=1095629 RepID=A0A0C9WNE7_9AGAR|nr:hypothetical protein K443DRAFT_685668 [Laccaria amethystina LaAM-08-1]
MSDLDADLYGDLYGNDETDFNQQAQEETPGEPAPAESPSTTTTTTTKAADIKPVVKPPQAIPTENGAGIGNTVQQQQQQQHYIQPVQTSYTQPAPQKIPTYEQPQPSEYREPPAPRTDGGYQNIPVTERSVRPSEMKDEG